MKATRIFLCMLWACVGIGAQEPDAGAPGRETGVYIPYEEFWRVFEREDRGVFLPHDEYRKLVERAREASRAEDPESLKGTLTTELAGELKVKGNVASGGARITVEAFSEGWHEVPLRLDGVTLTAARLDTGAARIRRDDKLGYVLMLEQREGKPSTHTLELEFSVLVKGEREKSIRFPLPDVAVNRWSFSVPEADVSFGSETPLAATRGPVGGAGEGRTVELLLAGHRNFQVKWTPEVEGARNMKAVITAKARQEFSIQPDIIRSAADISLRVDRADVEGVTLRLPATERVVNVSSDQLRSWTSEPAEEGVQRIAVVFQEPMKGDLRLRVDSERYDAPAAWEAPVIEVEGVERQSGSMLLLLDGALRVEPERVEGLSRLDTGAVERVSGTGGAVDAGWGYRALPAALRLLLEPVQPEIRLDTLAVAHLDPREVVQWVRAQFTVERAGVFQLSLRIPEGYELLDPSVAGKGPALDRHEIGPAEAGGRRVDFDFAGRVKGGLTLNFRLRREESREALLHPTGEEVELELPVVRAAGEHVARDGGRIVVGAPAFLSLRTRETDGAREAPWREIGLPPDLIARTQPQLGFRYVDEPARVGVSARRREPFTTVTQMLVMHAESGVLKFRSDLHVEVRYSGIRGLRVDVPTDLKDRIRIPREDIRRRELADAPDLEEGMTAWMLEGPGEFLGSFTLPLSWETPLEGMDVGVRRDIDIPRLTPRGVDRARGQIVLRKAESMDVVAREAGPGLTPIDPRHDLHGGRNIPDAALAYEFQGDWNLTATLVKYEPVDVKSTSIDRGWVRQVATRGGEVSVQALYQLRSTRQRLELRLPEGAEFDARPLHVNGRAVSLERGGDGQVYLPLTGFKADEAVLLELRYSLPESGGAFYLPHFPGNPAVQKIHLSVYLPENRVYLGHRGGWNPEMIWRVGEGFRLRPSGTRSPESLWARVNEGVGVEDSPLDRLPTDGQHLLFSGLRPRTEGITLRITSLPARLFFVLLIGGGVALGLLLLRASVRVRLAVSALLLSVLALAGVFLPSLARAVVNDATAAAALLVVLLWGAYDLVVRLPEARRKLPERRPPPVPARQPPVDPLEPPEPPENEGDAKEESHDA